MKTWQWILIIGAGVVATAITGYLIFMNKIPKDFMIVEAEKGLVKHYIKTDDGKYGFTVLSANLETIMVAIKYITKQEYKNAYMLYKKKMNL